MTKLIVAFRNFPNAPKKTALEGVDWICIVLNNSQWRAVVRTAINRPAS
jgi:hypothetical protein